MTVNIDVPPDKVVMNTVDLAASQNNIKFR